MRKKKEPQTFRRPVVINGIGGRRIVEEYDPMQHGTVEPVIANRREKMIAAAAPAPAKKKSKRD